MPSKNVLLVEDSDLFREAAADELIKAGFYVKEAGNGLAALAILVEGYRVDFVVTDLKMPDMDGAALITAIRNESNVPIFICSLDEDRAEILSKKFSNMIVVEKDPNMIVKALKDHA